MTKYDMELMAYELTYCLLLKKEFLTVSERKQMFNVKKYLIRKGVL